MIDPNRPKPIFSSDIDCQSKLAFTSPVQIEFCPSKNFFFSFYIFNFSLNLALSPWSLNTLSNVTHFSTFPLQFLWQILYQTENKMEKPEINGPIFPSSSASNGRPIRSAAPPSLHPNFSSRAVLVSFPNSQMQNPSSLCFLGF